MLDRQPVVEMRVRIINPEDNTLGPILTLKGRVAFACDELIRAGERGLTAIERPAYRWSDYIFKMRALGIVVETVHESHGGPFAGRHARYVLRTSLEVVEVSRSGESRNAA